MRLRRLVGEKDCVAADCRDEDNGGGNGGQEARGLLVSAFAGAPIRQFFAKNSRAATRAGRAVPALFARLVSLW